ncbi:MAG TPA: ferritin-like domain-containing protein, partial [Byssovorax sp.]
DADVPLDVLAAFARAVGDELRHTELCVAMAARFGARPSPSLPMRRPVVEPSTPARRARGLEIVAMQGAIGETLSCAFLRKGERLAEEPGVKAALRSIRKDEVMHARQSWEALGVLVPTLDDGGRASLHAHLRFGLGGVENNLALPALRQVEAKERVDPALATLGLVPPAERAHAFYRTIERRVIPALDELGLDGKLAWSERKRDWAPRPA